MRVGGGTRGFSALIGGGGGDCTAEINSPQFYTDTLSTYIYTPKGEHTVKRHGKLRKLKNFHFLQ